MRNPRDIKEIIPGVTYELPVYKVDNEGISDLEPHMYTLLFCKGVKNDESKLRQAGFLTESLLEVCKQYLETVNKEVPSRDTAMAITKIDECLMWLNKRQIDRTVRGVNQTNKQ